MRKVLILMSTYNGEKFLCEQLDSIYNQENVEFHLLVRDDGSKDSTISILKQYEYKYGKMTIICGENLGSARSFYNLVEEAADYDFDYYAFSDQDDIWHNTKLYQAIKKLEMCCEPIKMYCSNLNIVDTDGRFIKKKYEKKVVINKQNSLVQNIATGCTIVFNKEAKKIFLRHKPYYLVMHDYWLYLLCIYFGKVIFDENSFISYRQHGNNVIGTNYNFITTWRRRIKSFRKLSERPREKTAKELLLGYSDLLNKDDIKNIKIVADYRKSLRNLFTFYFSKEIKMFSKSMDFWLRVRILFHSV